VHAERGALGGREVRSAAMLLTDRLQMGPGPCDCDRDETFAAPAPGVSADLVA
jgi:hypothetical protein